MWEMKGSEMAIKGKDSPLALMDVRGVAAREPTCSWPLCNWGEGATPLPHRLHLPQLQSQLGTHSPLGEQREYFKGPGHKLF